MSYLKLYQDFLQQNKTVNISCSFPDDEDDADEDAQPALEHSTVSTSSNPNSGNNSSSGKMEHSYIRDKTRSVGADLSNGLSPARTILVRRPPQCPSCHTNPAEEQDVEDNNQAPVPAYNEIGAKESMNECARIAKYVKNNNSDDEDWQIRVHQQEWSNMQKALFEKVTRILDNDQLGRLANSGRQNEAMQRRAVVDKSAARMRKALASVAWDLRLTQWLHCLLMDCLPSTYMASYLDILQTLKSKLPSLMDKMLFARPLNISQELLAPVMKKQWEPTIVNAKMRKLTHNAVIVALPSLPSTGPVPHRLQKWYQHLAALTQIVQVTLPMASGHNARQPLDQIAEQIVSLTRVKIHDLRNEDAQRSIILVGFNAGAALALQVAMSETIACVVCMGFAYNTMNGTRGSPDDRILDIKVPILFVIGQNAARTSTEEIESLREKMQADTALVVVGSADDVLRVPKSRRKIENVTQAMVDAMVIDELYEFVKRILQTPPGPRIPTAVASGLYHKPRNVSSSTIGSVGITQHRKRKLDGSVDGEAVPAKTKYVAHIGRPRTRPLPAANNATCTVTPLKTSRPTLMASTPVVAKVLQKAPNAISNDDLNNAIQSILDDSAEASSSAAANASGRTSNAPKIITNFELVAQSKTMPVKSSTFASQLQKAGLPTSGITSGGAKIKMIPANQFVQLRPPMQSQSKIYTIKPSAMLSQTQNTSKLVSSTGGTLTGQQQIFTLKTPSGQTTQFVTAASSGAQQKYKVVKNATGGNSVQLAAAPKSAGAGSMDFANIIDMPILFADGEGNLSDAVTTRTGATDTTAKPLIKPVTGIGQVIINQKPNSGGVPLKGGTYIVGKTGNTIIQPVVGGAGGTQPLKTNKVVFINRTTMKPCPNILARSSAQQYPKFAKVLLTNPQGVTTTTTLMPHAPGGATISATPIVSTVKQVNLQALNATPGTASVVRPGGIVNVANKSFQILNAGTANGDRPQIRNILVKPGGLKEIPEHLKSQLINNKLTVRKLITIGPKPVTITTATTSTTADATTTSAISTAQPVVATTAIQTVPKIITLNPINPSTASSSSSSVTAPKTD